MKRFLIHNARRILACAVALAMMVPSVSELGSIRAEAAYNTELETDLRWAVHHRYPSSSIGLEPNYASDSRFNTNVSLGKAASYGAGNTTAFKWGWFPAIASGVPGWKFDIRAKGVTEDGDGTNESNESYLKAPNHSGTTYVGTNRMLGSSYHYQNPNGFNTSLFFGPSPSYSGLVHLAPNQTARPTSDAALANFYPGRDGELRNGEVTKVHNAANQYMELEAKLTIKPDSTGRYLIAEYVLHNSNLNPSNTTPGIVDPGATDGKRTVWIASGMDLMVSEDDYALAFSTPKTFAGNKIEGIHVQGNETPRINTNATQTTDKGRQWQLPTLDILTYHPQLDLGVEKRAGDNNSTIYSWLGHYNSLSANYFNNTGASKYTDDSAMAYSIKMELLPGETRTARIALSMKGPTYYVDPVNGVDDRGLDAGGIKRGGFIDSPFKTIQGALNKIKDLEPQVVYICIMGDINVSDTIHIPQGKDVTIMTTDYVKTGSAPGYQAVDIITDSQKIRTNSFDIKRDDDFDGPLFNVAYANSSLRFTDVEISGEDKVETREPLIKASAGNVELQSGAIIRNNKINVSEYFVDGSNGKPADGKFNPGENFTDADGNSAYTEVLAQHQNKASAIDISGSANLSMNYGHIRDNHAYQASAVKFDSSGKFTVKNAAYIKDNTNASKNGTGKANAYLGAGKIIEVTDRFTGEIGVSSAQALASAADEIPVVKNNTNTIAYTTNQFPADLSPAQWTQLGFNPINTGRVVLKAGAYNKDIKHESIDGVNLFNVPSTTVMAGSSILEQSKTEAELTAAGNPNYVLKDIEMLPATSVQKNISTTSAGTSGTVTGTMPGEDLQIKFIYEKNFFIAKFDSRGGSPEIIPQIQLPIGATMPNAGLLPVVTKPGFPQGKWYRVNDVKDANGALGTFNFDIAGVDGTKDTIDFASGEVTSLPLTATTRGTYLYAADYGSASATEQFEVVHKNINPTVPLTFKQESTPKTYQSVITASRPALIPGYIRHTQTVNPSSAGSFASDAVDTFNGIMPLAPVKVNYLYKVNRDASSKNEFKVEHKLRVGSTYTDIQAATSAQRYPETAISAEPIDNALYKLEAARVSRGDTANPSTYIVAVQDTKGIASAGSYNGATSTGTGLFNNDAKFEAYMPNQAVTVEYIYTQSLGNDVIRKYTDATTNRTIGRPEILTATDFVAGVVPQPGDSFEAKFAPRYGYAFSSATVTPAGFNVLANHNVSGVLPSGEDVYINYIMNRDGNYWKTISFVIAAAPYNKGTLTPSNVTVPILTHDGSAEADRTAHKFKDIQGVPEAEGNPAPYYVFDAWYKDAGLTDKVEPDTTFPSSGGNVTVYAKFVEDPNFWIDVNFAAGANGSISTPTAAMTHMEYDKTWGDRVSANLIPTPTGSYGYIFDKWTVDGNVVSASTPMENGKTYTANFKKDPNIWGGGLGSYDAVGRIGFDGSGEIKLSAITTGNTYVVTTLTGEIVGVKKATGSTLIFEDLYPGTRYTVQEGGADVVATVGSHISTATGTLSSPKPVLIPTVEYNYQVSLDPNDPERASITVNPADPDSDYALIDESGAALVPTGSAGGWMTPIGLNPAKITWTDLTPNETYTVVARKKGDASIPNPLTKIPEGNEIIANVGDELEEPEFVVETRYGTITSVAGTAKPSGTERVDDVKQGEEVSIHAEATDANGKAFKYWKVVAGRNRHITGNISQRDFTFTMGANNIVLRAVYERNVTTPMNATVEEEVRGGAVGEFAVDPYAIPQLEDDLTTTTDETLMQDHAANIVYKVIFNKRTATAAEKGLVEPVSYSGINHPRAFTAAWALDVWADRYIDGRKVDRDTVSNAVVKALIQLPAVDVDMLDYQVFDVTTGAAVEMTTVPADINDDLGLFSFDVNLNHKYVLVYSKVFKVGFVDNNRAIDYNVVNEGEVQGKNFFHRFKVRRADKVEDYTDADEYPVVQTYLTGATAHKFVQRLTDINGVYHTHLGLSSKNMPDTFVPFSLTAEIRKKQTVYVYYENNREAVATARTDLGNLIIKAEELLLSPYIKQDEIDILRPLIANSHKVLDMIYKPDIPLAQRVSDDDKRMANWDELQAALIALRNAYNPIKNDVDNRGGRFNGGGRSGGGSSGTAGKGNGTAKRPFELTSEKKFMLGVNGSWSQDPQTGKWKYTVNGGFTLHNTWGKIQTLDPATGKLLTNWYFFDGKSEMTVGWVYDEPTKSWYHMSTTPGATLGQMNLSWFTDVDGRRYYLDHISGVMVTGWKKILDKWYYFSEKSSPEHPLGSLYISTITPDGYKVNHDGEWIE